MLGGAYLCFEGFEKLAHRYLPSGAEDETEHAAHVEALRKPGIDMVAFERNKIRGAIRADSILSAEIIVITLGTVAAAPFDQQFTVLAIVAVAMTIGVYGLVAGIVKLDDGGLYLSHQAGEGMFHTMQRSLGRMILKLAPHLMKALSIAGTLAMFLVGGGILLHGIPAAHDLIHYVTQAFGDASWPGRVLMLVTPLLADAMAGILAGAVILGGTVLARRVADLVGASLKRS